MKRGSRRPRHFHLHKSPSSPYVLPVPPRRPCVGAGALSPEKGGALRKQSTQGRRLGVAAVLCGGVFVAPLLLLQHGSAHAPRVATAIVTPCRHTTARASVLRRGPAVTAGELRVDGPDDHTDDGGATTTDRRRHRRRRRRPHPSPPPAPRSVGERRSFPRRRRPPSRVHPHRAAPAPAPHLHPRREGERGQATWYAAAPPGMCASPTPSVRDGLDGDECRHRGEHDLHGR